MWIGVEGVPVKECNMKLIIQRCLKSGKHHIRRLKSKNKNTLNELETTEKIVFYQPNDIILS